MNEMNEMCISIATYPSAHGALQHCGVESQGRPQFSVNRADQDNGSYVQ